MEDDHFGHFIKGTFAGGGAKLYASLHGRLLLADRADLNRDGVMDLVITNSFDGKSHRVNSLIIQGNKDGAPTQLGVPTVGASACAVADLNDDDYPDLVFANEQNSSTAKVNSYIYLGPLDYGVKHRVVMKHDHVNTPSLDRLKISFTVAARP